MEPSAGRMNCTRTIDQAAATLAEIPSDVRECVCRAAMAFSVDPAKLLTGGQFNGDHPRTNARRYAIALAMALRAGNEESGLSWKYNANDVAGFFRVTRITVLNCRQAYPELYAARNRCSAEPIPSEA